MWSILVTQVSVFLLISYWVIYSIINFGMHYLDWRQTILRYLNSYRVCKDTRAKLFTHHVTMNLAYYFQWCFCQPAIHVNLWFEGKSKVHVQSEELLDTHQTTGIYSLFRSSMFDENHTKLLVIKGEITLGMFYHYVRSIAPTVQMSQEPDKMTLKQI